MKPVGPGRRCRSITTAKSFKPPDPRTDEPTPFNYKMKSNQGIKRLIGFIVYATTAIATFQILNRCWPETKNPSTSPQSQGYLKQMEIELL